MGIPNSTHQIGCDAVAAVSSWVSLHTGAGAGTTGANEASGGSYARKQTVFPSSTNASPAVATGSTVNILCAAGTYTEGGLNSAVTAGVFRGSAPFAGGNVVVSGTGASIDVTPSVSD